MQGRPGEKCTVFVWPIQPSLSCGLQRGRKTSWHFARLHLARKQHLTLVANYVKKKINNITFALFFFFSLNYNYLKYGCIFHCLLFVCLFCANIWNLMSESQIKAICNSTWKSIIACMPAYCTKVKYEHELQRENSNSIFFHYSNLWHQGSVVPWACSWKYPHF